MSETEDVTKAVKQSISNVQRWRKDKYRLDFTQKWVNVNPNPGLWIDIYKVDEFTKTAGKVNILEHESKRYGYPEI